MRQIARYEVGDDLDGIVSFFFFNFRLKSWERYNLRLILQWRTWEEQPIDFRLGRKYLHGIVSFFLFFD